MSHRSWQASSRALTNKIVNEQNSLWRPLVTRFNGEENTIREKGSESRSWLIPDKQAPYPSIHTLGCRSVVPFLQPQVPPSPTLQPGQHILDPSSSRSINENSRGKLSDYSKLFLTSRLVVPPHLLLFTPRTCTHDLKRSVSWRKHPVSLLDAPS